MAAPPRFQFSVRWLLLVTTAVAISLGIAAALEFPFKLPVVYGLGFVYLIFLIVWSNLPVPQFLRVLRDVRRRRREIDAKRAALAEEMRQIKNRKTPP